MTTTMIQITARDPIVARDGRPFGANQGNRMRSLLWPLPSVVAGSLRTLLGKVENKPFSNDVAEELKQIAVAGALPATVEDGPDHRATLYLPAPHDCVMRKDSNPEVLRVEPQPMPEGGGCYWPVGTGALLPVMLDLDLYPDDSKSEPGPDWWPFDRYVNWLIGEIDEMRFDHRFLEAPVPELRTHVQLDPETGAAEERRLFTTSAIPLWWLPRFGRRRKRDRPLNEVCAEVRLTTRVEAEGWSGAVAARLDHPHPLGGERRLVHWKAVPDSIWDCPPQISNHLKEAKGVRMVLATPAIFSGGWRPDWLDSETLTGSPPGFPKGSEVQLRLVGLTIERWQAVSGWSLADGGPKAIRRMVPAGGVYFFRPVEGSNPSDLAKLWLRSVSDDPQDRRDGFGLATWGIWDTRDIENQ